MQDNPGPFTDKENQEGFGSCPTIAGQENDSEEIATRTIHRATEERKLAEIYKTISGVFTDID
jgi:hypothetical protein